MSSSDRARALSRIAIAATLLLCLSFAPRAHAQDQGPNALALRFTLGGATITAPNDEVGEPTLLSGSAFTGPMFHGALSYARSLSGIFTLGAEIGLGRYTAKGFSEVGARRREIEFRSTSLDLLANARLHGRSGVVRPMGALLLGGRVGLKASATERRTGFTTSDPPVAIETHGGMLLGLEGGISIHTGAIEIPIAFRALNNLTYGRTTRDRLDGYRNVARPGNFQVESNWTYGLNLGLAYRF